MPPQPTRSTDTRSEKEKMLAGELYLAFGPELSAERLHAQHLFTRFNLTPPDALTDRTQLLQQLLGHLGEDTTVMPTLRCDYGYNIRIGARTFLNYDCILLDIAPIIIGDEVQIAPGVHLYTATHPTDPIPRRASLEYALPITIADGVWLGGRTVVCPGISIGEHRRRRRLGRHPQPPRQCCRRRQSLPHPPQPLTPSFKISPSAIPSPASVRIEPFSCRCTPGFEH